MRILGLEAATAAASVAVVEGDRLKGEIWFLNERTHSERILHGVDQVLRGADVSARDLEGVAVGLGPGFFTGLRIALATAKGLAVGLGIPLAGIPTLEVLAHNVPFWSGPICTMVDARRSLVYGGLYRSAEAQCLERLEAEGIREVESWVRTFSDPTVFVGTGALTYRALIENTVAARAHFAPPECQYPRGSVVARLGRERLRETGGDDVESLSPLYFRKSEAERRHEEYLSTGR